ncbi:hypothetical protein E2C01_010619 [Portunus trituberculatus]|uniref:Uncharacterized protein n=1 Tax=Portunus trituberculatus TaxID=210409 RepID=A0A5B7D9C2_PORTR|nr:hypothetical protein [Portunus trituberculatus]
MCATNREAHRSPNTTESHTKTLENGAAVVNGAQVGVPEAIFLRHELNEVGTVQVVLTAAVIHTHQAAQIPVGAGVVVGAAPLEHREQTHRLRNKRPLPPPLAGTPRGGSRSSATLLKSPCTAARIAIANHHREDPTPGSRREETGTVRGLHLPTHLSSQMQWDTVVG